MPDKVITNNQFDAACKRIDKNFSSGAELTANQVERIGEVCSHFRQTAVKIACLCVEGRELSLAMTKLEEAMDWACKSIVREERV